MTLKPSHPPEPTIGGLTASSAASPARTSATPGSERESKASAPVYGPNMHGSFAWYDRDWLSWKTWQRCFLAGWAEFLETWPRAGMTRNGIAFRLLPLVPTTSAIESFLWPTPNVPNGGRSVPEDAEWTTPRCAYRANGKKIQVGLESAVRRWPSPAATDWKGIYKAETVRRRASESTRGVRLPEQVSRIEGNSGALNPTWVEWLMGFPLGWTDLEDSATPSSRKSRSGSEGE